MRARLYSRIFGNLRRQRGLLLGVGAFGSGGGGGGVTFSVPTTPASSTATKIPIAPNLVAGPTGLDPYRPLRTLVVDGELFATNGYDDPRRWDRTNAIWAYMGRNVPTTLGLALSAAGTPAAIPTGQTPRYYLVGYDSTLDQESAPQESSIANASGATRDVTVTWTASEFDADQDKVRIYRALYLTDDFKFVADVAVATATYLDVSPDSAIADNATWAGSQRTTRPPRFLDFALADGVVYAWERASNVVRYSQGIQILGVRLSEDFPEGNIVQVGADDGAGDIAALRSFQGTKLLWKRRSLFEFTGFDATSYAISGVTGGKGRGTFNRDTVVPVGTNLVCLDELGVYEVTPGISVIYGGVIDDDYHVPFQPVLKRLNLAVADRFLGVHLEDQGVVVFWVALDDDPVPGHGIVYDHGTNKYVGLLTRRCPTAAGEWLDSSNVRHPIFGDDMGYAWEDLYAESEGVFAGTNAVATTGSSGVTITASTASFDTTFAAGPLGAPLDVYDSSGDVVDENRVYDVPVSTQVTAYLYPSTAWAPGDSLAVGVIPAVLETGAWTFGTHEEKWVRNVFLEYESGVDGAVRVDTALDDDDFALKWEENTLSQVRGIVPDANVTTRQRDECFFWRLRLSQRYANLGFSIRAIHVHWDVEPGRRK